MLFCRKCGRQLVEDAMFCPSCGTAVETSEQPATSVSPTQAGATVAPPAVGVVNAPPARIPVVASLKCPNCGAEDAQALQVIFDEGTQQLDGRQTGVGVGYGRGGGVGAVGVGVGRSKISGTTQSVLAQKAAPPQKLRLTGGVVTAIIGLVVLIGLTSSGGGGAIAAGVIVGIILMAGGIYWAYKASLYNKNEWPAAYQQWQKGWMCRRCGTIFTQT